MISLMLPKQQKVLEIELPKCVASCQMMKDSFFVNN